MALRAWEVVTEAVCVAYERVSEHGSKGECSFAAEHIAQRQESSHFFSLIIYLLSRSLLMRDVLSKIFCFHMDFSLFFFFLSSRILSSLRARTTACGNGARKQKQFISSFCYYLIKHDHFVSQMLASSLSLKARDRFLRLCMCRTLVFLSYKQTWNELKRAGMSSPSSHLAFVSWGEAIEGLPFFLLSYPMLAVCASIIVACCTIRASGLITSHGTSERNRDGEHAKSVVWNPPLFSSIFCLTMFATILL